MPNRQWLPVRSCDVCGEDRTRGNWLLVKHEQPRAWVCTDCQRMLVLRVDDRSTAGD
jgi:hypothetical protein